MPGFPIPFLQIQGMRIMIFQLSGFDGRSDRFWVLELFVLWGVVTAEEDSVNTVDPTLPPYGK